MQLSMTSVGTRARRLSKTIKIDQLIERLLSVDVTSSSNVSQNFILSEEEIQCLCNMAKVSFASQPMLLELKPPLNICGDIHGQYRDLLFLFSKIGKIGTDENYLFLGDYVDRGKRSLECFCLLMAYKVKYPNNFFLLRGNHECSEVNKMYGFYDECKRRLDSTKTWKTICGVFDYLPISAIVGDRIFCVHGGLSPKVTNLCILNSFKRPLEPMKQSPLCDMLWSDPSKKLDGWIENVDRGVGYYFGPNIIDDFLKKYDFDLICRSHQVVEEGYEFMHDRKLITVFSAPNYCGQFENMGAVLKVNENMKCSLEQFQSPTANQIIKKMKRSLTPIPVKKSGERGKSVSPLKKQVKEKEKKKEEEKENVKTSTEEGGKDNKNRDSQRKETTCVGNNLQKHRQQKRKVTNLYALKQSLKKKEFAVGEEYSNDNTEQSQKSSTISDAEPSRRMEGDEYTFN